MKTNSTFLNQKKNWFRLSLIILSLQLWSTTFSLAQNVNIPDANFKSALLANPSINTNADGEIQESEAAEFTGGLILSNLGISDLNGIEAFTSLTYLNCSDNSLNSLNVSNNSLLDGLECINCSLSTLDVSLNNAMTLLYCSDNNLNSLNMQNGNNTNLLNFNATNNPSLTCIEVDNADYMNAIWSDAKDLSATYNENCPSCIVNIPDANFKAYLLGEASINTNEDNEIQCDEASAYSGIISAISLGITDLTGIEAFINLTMLSCSFNQLTSIDVSANTALTMLQCDNNLLTTLDVSNNIALTWLECRYNELTDLDVSSNALIERLYCNNNPLGSLDVSTNGLLERLDCHSNGLTVLDVSSNTLLEVLFCTENSLTGLDISNNPLLNSLYCYQNSIAILDLSTNPLITNLACNNNALTELNLQNGSNTELDSFNATGNANLTCVEVDNVAYMNTNWPLAIPADAEYSLSCIIEPTVWYLDADNDGWYVSAQEAENSPGEGWTSTLPIGGSGDCDDSSQDVYPGATEICGNEIDEDCDGAAQGFGASITGEQEVYWECNGDDAPPILVVVEGGCPDDVIIIVSDQPVSSEICGITLIRTYTLESNTDFVFIQIIHVIDVTPPSFTQIPTTLTAYLSGWQTTVLVPFDVIATDNCGSPEVSVSHSPSTPFSIGTTIVTATAIDACGNETISSFSVVVFPSAPASNNNPAPNNPTLNSLNFVYPNCAQIQGTTIGATASIYTGHRDVWYQFTAISNGISIKVGSNMIDAKIFLFRSDNLGVILSEEDLVVGSGAEILNFDGLESGVSYRIAVASMGSNDGLFSLCMQKLKKPNCASNGVLSLCSSFQTSGTGASSVTFSFMQGEMNSIITSSTPIILGNPALQLQYGNSYNVGLTANYVLQNGLGQNETMYVYNADACTITIANQPEVVVKTNQRCPATLFRLNYLQGELIGAGNICGLTGYRVEFTPVNNCNGDNPQNLQTFTRDINGTAANISLNYAFNHIPLFGFFNIGYWKVRWAPKFGSTVGTYGNPHIIAVNGTGAAGMTLLEQSDMIAPIAEISANLYPNPNTGDMVNLNLTGIEKGDVFVRILDGMGRVVYNNRYVVEGSLNTIVTFSKPLASGIYLVEFTSDNKVITQRMVVGK